ncbi:MAG: DUF4258 domain-containing protein [Mariprofundales bacterium]
MITTESICQCVNSECYRYSLHGDKERMNDMLSLIDVEEALLSGRILEQYPDTGRGESCLVVGFSDKGKPIHIVCGMVESWLILITVYIPKPPKFITPFQRSN